MKIEMPPQIDPLKENEVENFVDKTEILAQTLVYGALIIGSFFSLPLALLVGMINVFQIMSHLPMFNILLTDNIYFFLGEM